MKPNLNESYESWVNRVKMFEHGIALQSIAQGKDINDVLEKMSYRIIEKLLHPIYKSISNSIELPNLEESKKKYKEIYIDKVPRAPDHIDDDIT